ncbi:YidC/Oxa1 family membrane protein insertase [Zhenhengia yiwuensis]|uniref:YidC/Oxa1 family membrane protein insertase n=1 Tax=Zhenhengia yiwuensis TaxID=2763666 RepID=UPI002A74CCC2|nr:YidC/Oxa1 family membrane protein insertase [Zhenhengia yiwuensis]MDY3368576.1 YidC/Oxa1 family membrane protein insertase [Zhenhengia yiwuensis]
MGIINSFFGMILNLIFEGIALLTPVGTLGLTIIVFTVVTRLLLTPLQIKQMRTTRAMSKIQPELTRIQKKYANKKDQQSQMAYSQELQAIYKKYKISPFAGCLPLLIQLPLIYALYNVLRQPSRYISKLSEMYTQLADVLAQNVANVDTVINEVVNKVPLSSTAMYELQKLGDTATLADKLSHFTTDQWNAMRELISPQVYDLLSNLLEAKHGFEYFIVNLVDSPSQLVANGQYLALLIPIAAGASTFIFSKITMAASKPATPANGEANPADSMMKVMNIMMPIMMGWFSYTVPNGLALYWISGNIIMMVQQIWVNKIVDKQQAVLEEQLRKDREAALAAQGVKKKKKKKKLKPEVATGEVEQKAIDEKPKKPKKTASEDETTNSTKED